MTKVIISQQQLLTWGQVRVRTPRQSGTGYKHCRDHQPQEFYVSAFHLAGWDIMHWHLKCWLLWQQAYLVHMPIIPVRKKQRQTINTFSNNEYAEQLVCRNPVTLSTSPCDDLFSGEGETALIVQCSYFCRCWWTSQSLINADAGSEACSLAQLHVLLPSFIMDGQATETEPLIPVL